MKVLLLSNSTNHGEAYLGWPREILSHFIQSNGIRTCLFVPYAGVTTDWDDYTKSVAEVFSLFGCEIKSVHTESDTISALKQADCVVIGGGNTFRLVQKMQSTGIMDAIRDEVVAGKPFIGWSAGSNVACPTLCTTNDMPIIQPESFKAMNLVPFQINPHYLDANPEGHGGETREQRINEFHVLNPEVNVVGLREATALLVDENTLKLIGSRPMRLFKAGMPAVEYTVDDNLDFLLKK